VTGDLTTEEQKAHGGNLAGHLELEWLAAQKAKTGSAARPLWV
jgi:hypothetical protein